MLDKCPHGGPIDCYYCKDKDICNIWIESDAKALDNLISDLKKAGWGLKDLKEHVTLFYYG